MVGFEEAVDLAQGVLGVIEGDEEAFSRRLRRMAVSKASMSGRPTRSFCFTWIGYQRSCRESSPSPNALGSEPTGKMRPSMPMSPTCALFGMPPRAMVFPAVIYFRGYF